MSSGRSLLPFLLLTYAQVSAPGPTISGNTARRDFLSNNTVLIIRHAEKPASGKDLTLQGEARAQAYTHYFEPFHEEPFEFRVDALYAGADSDNSIRPRRTLEPLSQSTGLKLNISISTKEPGQLVTLLHNEPHGAHPLIAWRHGQIPALLSAFGASATTLLPDGKWRDEVYDWVIVLGFDSTGHLRSAQRLKEHLAVPAN